MERETEEAAWTLGASPWLTFTKARAHVLMNCSKECLFL
jgi:ABC-type sulfate transport system permease component